MQGIKHIFFDLDHTIWDFEKNSSEAIHELFFAFNLDKKIESVSDFIETYQRINSIYWQKYRDGEINKETVRTGRFYDTFKEYNIDNLKDLAIEFGDQYIQLSPKKNHIFPHTHETLKYLDNKYPLHIITNGFKEIVDIKLRHSDLSQYFDIVICSEEIGVNKPNPLVFAKSLEKAGASPNESVMIGDSYEVDIQGAKNSGMKTIFFNPNKVDINTESIQIHCLSELQKLL